MHACGCGDARTTYIPAQHGVQFCNMLNIQDAPYTYTSYITPTANDVWEVRAALDKYCEIDPNFQATREEKLLRVGLCVCIVVAVVLLLLLSAVCCSCRCLVLCMQHGTHVQPHTHTYRHVFFKTYPPPPPTLRMCVMQWRKVTQTSFKMWWLNLTASRDWTHGRPHCCCG